MNGGANVRSPMYRDQIDFHKEIHVLIYEADASGNTFLVHFLARDEHIPRTRFFDTTIDWERYDSLLVLTDEIEGVRMRIFERDGSESAMCGNGSRVAAFLMHRLGIDRALHTGAGPTGYVAREDGAAITIPKARYLGDERIHPLVPAVSMYSACGEPHAVLSVPDVFLAPLPYWGSLIVPRANCTVVDTKDGTLRARTFERGVERITRSCGTGACAALAHALRTDRAHASGFISMNDEILEIHHHGETVTLGGPVSLTFLRSEQPRPRSTT